MLKSCSSASSAKAKTIHTMRGTIPVDVVVDRKNVLITDKVMASEGTEFKVGKESLKITGVRQSEDGDLHLHIAVPPRQSGVRWLWQQRIHVEDAAGNRYADSSDGWMQSGGQYEILKHYRLSNDPKVGPPSKLIVEDWVILHHAISFEFKDVPLP